MKIKVNDSVVDVSSKEIRLSLEFIAKFEDVSGYSIGDKITDKVSRVVADKILDTHMNEILAKVDIETIVRKVQMNIIQDLSRK